MGYNKELKSEYLVHDGLATQKSRPLSKLRPVLLRVLFSLGLVIISCIIYTNPLFQTPEDTNPFLQPTVDGPPLSCSPEANFTDSCLVENPCGLVLLAQMYDHKSGPIDNWSIHGLWGNFCDGSYPASCEPSREVDDIPAILRENRELFLLNYMTFNWPNFPPVTQTNGTAADLWAHEWNKHGTCMSTIQPSCYPDFKPGQDIVDYFHATISISQKLPTFQFLESCGIAPSRKETYSFVDIEGCLAAATGGYTPHIGCSEDGYLNEIWYYHHWLGPIRGGHGYGTNSTVPSSCPKDGIKYPPQERSKYA